MSADADNGEFGGNWLSPGGSTRVVPLSLIRTISDIPTVSFYIHKDAMSLYNIFFYIIPSKK